MTIAKWIKGKDEKDDDIFFLIHDNKKVLANIVMENDNYNWTVFDPNPVVGRSGNSTKKKGKKDVFSEIEFQISQAYPEIIEIIFPEARHNTPLLKLPRLKKKTWDDGKEMVFEKISWTFWHRKELNTEKYSGTTFFRTVGSPYLYESNMLEDGLLPYPQAMKVDKISFSVADFESKEDLFNLYKFCTMRLGLSNFPYRFSPLLHFLNNNSLIFETPLFLQSQQDFSIDLHAPKYSFFKKKISGIFYLTGTLYRPVL